MATSGVLFMKALIVVTGSIIRTMADVVELGWPNSRWAKKSTPPVSRTPAPTTNSTPTVTMPSFDKPDSAWVGSMTPANSRMATAPTKATSGETRVKINAHSASPSTASVNQASQPMFGHSKSIVKMGGGQTNPACGSQRTLVS